ncbi:MAG: Maleylpyruvate isomerase family mycothiol-dependent enzyme [Chloroflexi bacterium]|nr:Maleylpyruvate isomerase family mycothiol-dependent enzyme [Chloroflexota bacterium]
MADRRSALRDTLKVANDALLATLNTLDSPEWNSPSPNDGWSAKDTLAHITSIEERERMQIRAILGEGEFPTDDVNIYNERMIAERRGWTVEQLLAELAKSREATLAILDGIGEEDLDHYFDHPRRGRLTVAGIYEHIAEHTGRHAADIAAVRPTS